MISFQRKARSRRAKVRFQRKIRILAISTLLLLSLLLIYAGEKLLANAYIFSPVQSLAEGILPPVIVETKEVPVDHTFTTEKQKILAYIVEKFGERAPDMISIINLCENHAFKTDAVNHNANGSCDVGVTQENTSCSGPEFEHLKQWKFNIDEAYRKYHAAGDTFRPWTCTASVLHEPNYLGETK